MNKIPWLDPSRATTVTLCGSNHNGYDETYFWLGADRDDGNHSVVVVRLESYFGRRAADVMENFFRAMSGGGMIRSPLPWYKEENNV